MYLILYAKIVDDKKEGISLIGPTIGPTRDSFSQAEDESRALINQNRHCTIIPRIYEIENIMDIGDTLHDAREYFTAMYKNMVEAKEAMSRPIHRRRKKKMVKAEVDEASE